MRRFKFRGPGMAGLVAALLAVVGPAPTRADEKKSDPKGETAILNGADVKPVAQPLAARTDFNAALGLPFHTLADLGPRIDKARLTRDPVGLMLASSELSAMEKLSGKTATIKADDLTKEAIDLAVIRGNPNELKALVILAKPEAAKELGAAVKKAAAAEAEAKAALVSGERARGLKTLKVENGTGSTVFVEINGQVVAYVLPYQQFTFNVNHGPATNTVIKCGAIINGAPYLWPTVPIFGNQLFYVYYCFAP
jgi:hypothetical protein